MNSKASNQRSPEGQELSTTPALRVRVFLIPNHPGFDVIAADLPGTVSYGDTEAAALENIREAVRMTLAECEARGMESPWVPGARPEDATIEHCCIIDA
jgi:predicted RNase H-like HicB family nuclease